MPEPCLRISCRAATHWNQPCADHRHACACDVCVIPPIFGGAAQRIADESGATLVLPLGSNDLQTEIAFHPVLRAVLGRGASPGVEENKMTVLPPSSSEQHKWTYWKRNMVPLIEAPYTNVHGGNATPATHSVGGSLGQAQLGTAICFDMEHPAFIRRAYGGAQGADILLNPSYDWPGLNPYHAHIAAFRAIETGASVVHHCMAGTSLAVDYRGVVLSHNDHFSTHHAADGATSPKMVAMVPLRGVSTLYADVFGDSLAYTCVVIVVVLLSPLGGSVVMGDWAAVTNLLSPKGAAAAFRAGVSQPVRFFVSGTIGSVAFWILNEAIAASLPDMFPGPGNRVTTAWFLSYLVSIWLQHALHSTLVYGWGKGSYASGLFATYCGYSGALIAGVPINYGLASNGLGASAAWLGTLLITGAGNYFLLSSLLGDSSNQKQGVE